MLLTTSVLMLFPYICYLGNSMFCVVQNIQENIHILCDNIRMSLEAKSVSALKAEWYFGPLAKSFSMVILDYHLRPFHYISAGMTLV